MITFSHHVVLFIAVYLRTSKLKKSAPSFKIKRIGNQIHVKLSGIWTIQADLAYLTQLIECIHEIKGAPWVMFVDMQEWELPIEVFESEFKTKILLDRRNQIAESWLVNDMQQGELLLYFFRHSKVKPKRFVDRNEALNWLTL